MSFAKDVRSAPLPFDPAQGDACAEHLPDTTAKMRDLIRGVGGCSPYLAQSISKEADWIAGVIDKPIGTAVELGLADLADAPPQATSHALRVAKRRIALLAALADCGGVWTLSDVTGALTQLADVTVQRALKTALSAHAKKLPSDAQDPGPDLHGLTALAMGKYGAGELNYSSDIDMIILFDDARFAARDVAEARMVFVRAVRRAMALLSENTADGYVFRTDLRLRPDPSVTPVAVSMSAAERYYESLGRTWERAAFIKARPCGGDVEAGYRFLDHIRPFIWRRHLDFATLEDTEAMLDKIRSQKQLWDQDTLDGRDLKLGPGGIRQIEFFVQTRQLIAGGRDRSLRVRGTCDGLEKLAQAGWIPSHAAAGLTACYERLRNWEHRLQMVHDNQTHALPKDAEAWARLSHFMGHAEVDRFQAEIKDTLHEVQELTSEGGASTPAPTSQPVPQDRLHDITERWHRMPALRTDRARSILSRLLPDLLQRFDKAAQTDEALAQFESFLARLPAGVQVFSLFEANPQLIDLMVDIASTSPALAQYLAREAQVLDAVIDGDFFAPWPGCEALVADLTARLRDEAEDYENQLDAVRRWHKDWHFRIGVHHLRGLCDPLTTSAQYADLAEATVKALWPVVVDQFAAKHGAPPGRGAAILGMGSLGAQSLTATSDLDLIVIYDAPGEGQSDGRRPLPVRSYYARLTKALVTALSVQTAEGMLYAVDMRLRPSGRQGPVATAWSAFQTYQREEAWTWEHMALTRARVIGGHPDLCTDLEGFRREVLAQPSDPTKVWQDLADMRRRLRDAKPRTSVWDVDTGEGGRQDIELLASALTLLSGGTGTNSAAQLSLSPLPEDRKSELIEAHTLMSHVKLGARLLTGGSLDPHVLGEGGSALLLRDTAKSSMAALERALHCAQTRSAKAVESSIEVGVD